MKLSILKGNRRTLKKATREYRVFLRSHPVLPELDITDECQSIDTRRGMALLLLRDGQGRHYIEHLSNGDRVIAKRWFKGRVRIERRRKK